MSKLSPLSEVAKFRNSKLKVKVIANDMILYQSGKGNVTNLAKKIRKVLEQRESSWNADQKNLLLKRIKSKNQRIILKSYCKVVRVGEVHAQHRKSYSLCYLQNLIYKKRFSKQS